MGMYIKTLEVAGFESALHGMRNPMNSWDKSDSVIFEYEIHDETEFSINDYRRFTHSTNVAIGEEDLKLAQRLIKGGGEHRKFMRQIQVWADFNMPRYLWSEFDTYHFNTKNSCSTMHKLFTEKEIDIDDFVCTSDVYDLYMMGCIVDYLNGLREEYLESKDYSLVIRAKRLLPESFLQMRTVNTNYEELRNMYIQRRHHRLKEEWVDTFCKWVESLPYAKELILYGIKEDM